VLELIADGLSAPEMAARLTLSVATIKSHQGTLYDKLDVSDRAAAAAKAIRIGLLE
jgi:two-component system nitrate/nitrite response regulator NarL